jgi:hypothetical protein
MSLAASLSGPVSSGVAVWKQLSPNPSLPRRATNAQDEGTLGILEESAACNW